MAFSNSDADRGVPLTPSPIPVGPIPPVSLDAPELRVSSLTAIRGLTPHVANGSDGNGAKFVASSPISRCSGPPNLAPAATSASTLAMTLLTDANAVSPRDLEADIDSRHAGETKRFI